MTGKKQTLVNGAILVYEGHCLSRTGSEMRFQYAAAATIGISAASGAITA